MCRKTCEPKDLHIRAYFENIPSVSFSHYRQWRKGFIDILTVGTHEISSHAYFFIMQSGEGTNRLHRLGRRATLLKASLLTYF